MAISTATHQAISKGRFDEIEDNWLGQIEKDATDLPVFTGIARALVGVGETKRATLLLEMLDDHFSTKELWQERLELLRASGHIYQPDTKLHSEILGTLRNRYPGIEVLEKFFVTVALNKALEDNPKTWEKVDRLEELLSYTKGTPVEIQGKGAGRVVEINLELESFKVDLEIVSGLKVGFRAAAKMMRVLSEHHILYRKLVHPEELTSLRDEGKPWQLLQLVLESYDTPLTGAQVKEVLRGVIDASKWSSWWTSARKHPNVVASVGGRQSYHWASSGEDAVESLQASFDQAKTHEKISLFKKNSDRNPEFLEHMSQGLIAVADAEDKPAVLLEIWQVLDKAGTAPAEAAWLPRNLVAEARDAPSLLRGLKDRQLRQLVFDLVLEHRDDWHSRLPELLSREEDPKLLEHLVSKLPQAQHDRLVGDLMSNARKKPAAFTWLAERAANDEDVRNQNPLRLLQQILMLLSQIETGMIRKRLDKLFESGSTVPRIIPSLDVDQARRALEAIERSTLVDFEKTPLVNAIKLRFPELDQSEDTALYALPTSIERKRAELKKLVEVELPENRVAIETARAHGDLRENFEYHAARQRHEYLSARSGALHMDLDRARPIEMASGSYAEVRIGACLGLESDTGKRDLAILGPWESDPEQGVISYESDIGKDVIGKAVGEHVDLEGESYRIASINAYSLD